MNIIVGVPIELGIDKIYNIANGVVKIISEIMNRKCNIEAVIPVNYSPVDDYPPKQYNILIEIPEETLDA